MFNSNTFYRRGAENAEGRRGGNDNFKKNRFDQGSQNTESVGHFFSFFNLFDHLLKISLRPSAFSAPLR